MIAGVTVWHIMHNCDLAVNGIDDNISLNQMSDWF